MKKMMATKPDRMIGHYLLPHLPMIIVIMILQIVGVIAQVVAILLLKPILDEGVYGNDMNDILVMGGILVVVTVIYSIMTSLSSFLSSKIAAATAHQMRMDIMDATLKSQNLDQKNSTTNTMTILTTDVDIVQKFIFEGLRTYLPMPVLMIALLACTYYYNETVAIMLGILFVIVVVLTHLLYQRIVKLLEPQLIWIDRINTSLRQKISGTRTIRAYDGFDYETDKFGTISKNLGKHNNAINLNSYYIPHLVTAIMWICVVFIYVFIAINSVSRMVVPTEIIIFMQYTSYFIATLSIIPFIGMERPRARSCSLRINNIVKILDERATPPLDMKGDGSIVISNLSINDSLGGKTVENINMNIATGNTVSIIGPIGCGCHYIGTAIMGFSRPSSGKLIISGCDVKDVPPEHIRSMVSYTGNNMNIIPGTLRFNLDPHGHNDDTEILRICSEIGLDRWVSQLPNGLDTYVTDDKASISGGQKQLVLIARAILKHAEINIFDNCFFSLDTETKKKVMDVLEKSCQDKTVIFIMNDAWTCPKSSKVYLMDCGVMSCEGTHESLLKESQLYRDMNSIGQTEAGTWA